jgi:selenocysteine lyase/cysteine desulfurase
LGPHRLKWLCASTGAGFLYVRRELQRDVHPLQISWGYEGDDPSFVSRHQKQGTRDPSAYLTVPAAIAWQHEHNWGSVRERSHELARRARNELGLEPVFNRGDERVIRASFQGYNDTTNLEQLKTALSELIP